MNTLLYLWIEPMVMHNKRCVEKYFFNCIIEGEHTKEKDLNSFIESVILQDIMDFANIDSNWNYSVISSVLTSEEPLIEFADSPKIKKEKKNFLQVVAGEKELVLTKKDMNINDGGIIDVAIPSLGVYQTFDFSSVWKSIEKNFLGKIKEGDEIKLTDDEGNILFEIHGGNFLCAPLGDMTVNNKDRGIIGGLFIRDDGSLDIGDTDRTFYLKIYSKNLLLNSMKTNKSIMDLIQLKITDGE